MIPKVIHYCWFGRNPKPKLAEKCIKSWKKYCPDYEIIEWNEDNYDISTAPLFVRQAYEAGKWAFVTDYVRLAVVYEFGGIYLDTDVELRKNPDFLLNNKAFFGFQDEQYVNTGLGFGAEKGTPILRELMANYESAQFILPDGTQSSVNCPARDTAVFLRHGLVQNDKKQFLDDETLILPKVFLSPISFETKEKHITRETISIHWFSGSWMTEEQRQKTAVWQMQQKRIKRADAMHFLVHIPNRLAMKLLGEDTYSAMKQKVKKR